MKFIKLAEGSFDKFYMKWPLVYYPLFVDIFIITQILL